MKLFKYSGAGNDFVLVDGRSADVSAYRQPETIGALCSRGRGVRSSDGRVGSDGLMILDSSSVCDFKMEFYNPDGSSGMMCGNGGRCIVAFADSLGIVPSDGKVFRFEAPDGLHRGEILRRDGPLSEVRISMVDVKTWRAFPDGGWFLNTGTRHYVRFVEDVETLDVESEGRALRWNPEFAPEGVNVNFVSISADGLLHVRTFEKGVEAETLACGTGIVASCIAAYLRSHVSQTGDLRAFEEAETSASGSPALALRNICGISALAGIGPAADRACVKYRVRARQDFLSVDFRPVEGGFRDVRLTGPALQIPIL